MSRYVTSLVERARGEGAILEPRPRGRFEPGGIAEAAVESSAASPASRAPLVTLVRSATTNVDTTLTNVTNLSPPAVVEERGEPAPDDVRPQSEPLPRENATLRVESSRLSEHSERVERERTHHQSHDTTTRERERLTEREQRTTEKSERSERTHRIERVTQRERTVEREREAPRVHITIGRVDVRAIAPQAQPPRAPAKPKAPAPLTLDDYLRGKR